MKRFMNLRFRPAWGATIVFAMILPIGFSAEAGAQCVGDCDGNGQVLIPEVQRCVNLNSSLSTLPCDNADQNSDGTVDDNEVNLCIQSFLDEENCPMVFTPAATNTPMDTPTPMPTDTQPPVPTATPTSTPTHTFTPTATNTPTLTPTNTMPPTPTDTPAVPIGTHRCTLSNASKLALETELFPVPPLNLTGSIDIDCGTIDPATGKSVCECSIVSFDAIPIVGIGTVCVDAGTAPCDQGEIDCDGGNVLGWNLMSDRKLGTCTGNDSCAADCATHCSGMGAEVFQSGCDGFCSGGSADGDACTADTDCPGGSCNGQDGVGLGNVCGCQCLAQTGTASAAGSMACNLPSRIFVVLPAGSPCTSPPTINLGTLCLPLTTDTASGVVTNANGGTGKIGPNSSTGTPFQCGSLQESVTSGGKLTGVVNFFGSTLGDLVVTISSVCQ